MAHTQPIDQFPPQPPSRPSRSLEEDQQPRVRPDEMSRMAEGPARASYLNEADTDSSWQRWREIQANFVDEPRSAVGEAHQLVSELMDQIVRSFDEERRQLEQRWQSGADVSTDELRHCLQRYRDFFGRLLANASVRDS